MRVWLSAVSTVVGLCGGCVAERAESLRLPEQTQSVLVGDEGTSQLSVFEAQSLSGGLPLVLSGEGPHVLRVSPHSLEALGLKEGPISVNAEAPRCGLEASRTVGALFPAGFMRDPQAGVWSEAAPDELPLGALELPSLDLVECSHQRRCIVGQGEQRRCEPACPRPSITPPSAPIPPAPPCLDPIQERCGVERFEAEIQTCDVAGLGSVRQLGECAGLTAPCPALWPEGLDETQPLLFVRPGGQGSGTRASPLGSLETAIAQAGPGDTIVLSVGTHEGPVVVNKQLSIIGACAQTKLESTDPNEPALRVIRSAELELQNLSVFSSTVGLRIQGTVRAQDVWVEVRGERAQGLEVPGTLQADGLMIFGQSERSGLVVNSGGQVEVSRVSVQGMGQGLTCFGDIQTTSLRASKVLIEEVERPIRFNGCESSIQHAHVIAPGNEAVYARDDAQVSFEDAVIRSDDVAQGTGLYANNSTVTFSRIVVEGYGEHALLVESGTLDAIDFKAVLLESNAITTPIHASDGASISLRRVEVDAGVREFGVRIREESWFSIEDLRVTGGGEGIRLSDADGSAQRVALSDQLEVGLRLRDRGIVELLDVDIMGAQLTGLRIDQYPLPDGALYSARMERLRVRGTQYGLLIEHGRVQGRDVETEATDIGVSIVERGFAEPDDAPVDLELDGFLLGGGALGLEMVDPDAALPLLQRGVFKSNGIGVSLKSCKHALAPGSSRT